MLLLYKENMIIITATWKAKSGKESDLQQHLQTMVDKVKKYEPDCLQYTLHQDLDDKSQFFFYERYKNHKAIEVHKNTQHFKELIANTESLIDNPVQVNLLKIVQ